MSSCTKTRRRNASVSRREYSETIPFDLVIEILSRLPAKSIARCRCVSKLWESTLHLSCFTDLFLTRSPSRPQLLFSYQEEGNLIFFSSPQPQNIDKYSLSFVSANYQTKFPVDGYAQLCGSVHGLVCTIHTRETKRRSVTVLVICNPSTGQSLTLPKVKPCPAECFFGYDAIEKQYKVLSVTHSDFGNRMISQVLTLGTGNLTWRTIQCNIAHHPIHGGICMDGVLYYKAWDSTSLLGVVIICFDFTSEKFRLIKKDESLVLTSRSVLVNYKGKLCALLYSRGCYDVNRTTRSFEMWVLENAEKHEWSKHVYKFPTSFLKNVVQGATFWFIGVIGTNEIVLWPLYPSNSFNVIYYNFERKTFRREEIQGMDVSADCRVHISLDHVENVKLMDA